MNDNAKALKLRQIKLNIDRYNSQIDDYNRKISELKDKINAEIKKRNLV